MSDYRVWDHTLGKWVSVSWEEYAKVAGADCPHREQVEVWTVLPPVEHVADICLQCDEQLTRNEWIKS